MIKSPVYSQQTADSTLDTLNDHLQTIKRKLNLLFQVLFYFSLQTAENKQHTFLSYYSQLKEQQKTNLVLLRPVKNATIDQKVFDRLCLRIYEQYESVSMKLKKIKLPYLNFGQLLSSVQSLLYSQRSGQNVNVYQFLLKLIACEEAFKLHSLKKIYNQVKKTDEILAEQCKELFKNELRIKLEYDTKYEEESKEKAQRVSLPNVLSTMDQGMEALQALMNSRRRVSDSSNISISKELSNFYKKTNNVQQTPFSCQHCELMRLMDVVNIQEYSHTMVIQREKLFETLTVLNVKNRKYIDGFRKYYKKVNKMNRPPPTPQTQHRKQAISTAQRPASIEIKRIRTKNIKSVIITKDHKDSLNIEDREKEKSLKKIADRLKKPSLSKLTEYKQQLQFLRDLNNQRTFVFRSFNNVSTYLSERTHDNELEDMARIKELVAFPRIKK